MPCHAKRSIHHSSVGLYFYVTFHAKICVPSPFCLTAKTCLFPPMRLKYTQEPLLKRNVLSKQTLDSLYSQSSSLILWVQPCFIFSSFSQFHLPSFWKFLNSNVCFPLSQVRKPLSSKWMTKQMQLNVKLYFFHFHLNTYCISSATGRHSQPTSISIMMRNIKSE